MEARKVVLTAGFDKSKFAICVADLLLKNSIIIDHIFVVNPIKIDRVKKLVIQQGVSGLKRGFFKLFNITSSKSKEINLLDQFMEQNNVPTKSLKKWASLKGVKYQIIDSINDSKIENYLIANELDWMIYCGGGIIRKNIIFASSGKILNAHLGPLPEIRGMNAIEWSILLNERSEITIHKIDEGIDTGDIINQYPVKIDKNDTIDTVRDKAKIVGINGILDVVTSNLNSNKSRLNSDSYRQCFILSNSMKELLEFKLSL